MKHDLQEQIAKLILEMHGSESWKIQDAAAKDGDGRRVPQYGDIAILLPVLTHADAIEDALHGFGLQDLLRRSYHRVGFSASDKEPLNHVTDAGGKATALQALRAQPFDLVLLDLVMPGLSGMELSERIRDLRPQARHLLLSGYPGGTLAGSGLAASALPFLQKPFTVSELLRAVRQTLDAG